MREELIRVGARELFTSIKGAGDPVVLLHGGGPGASGVANWRRNIEALAEAFTVIVPDLPGYGRSTREIDHDDPFGDLAAAVGGLLDALDISRANLIGNSYGGGAALRLALDRPDRVDRMVLNGPGGIGTTRWVPTRGLNQLLDYYGGEGPTLEKMRAFITESLVSDPRSVPDDIIELRYQHSLDPASMANPPLKRPDPGPKALRTLLRMDLSRDKRLGSCETPTLVIWGVDDAVNRPVGGPLLAKRMRNCDLYLASNVGHWVQWEAPELFNRLALDFLGAKR
ncbi:MAG: alpha/beta fold hydrolase [Nocardioides sp.]